MPIRRRRRKDRPNGSPESDAGGVRVDGSDLHVGRDLIGRDNVQIGSQNTYHVSGAGVAAIVAVVGLVVLAVIVTIVWREQGAVMVAPATAQPTSDAVARAVPPTMTVAPVATPTVEPTRAPTPTAAPTATPVPTTTPQPKPMGARYVNIALAPIGRVDAGGKVLPWPESGRFLPLIHERLASELKPLIDAREVDIRSEGVGLVEGTGEEARGKFADKLRADHHADLLIFANLQNDGGRSVLIPGFNIGPLSFDDRRGRLDGAEEIVGTSRLRLPLMNPNPVTAPDELADRANALVYFALGLTYLQAADSVPSPRERDLPPGEYVVRSDNQNLLYSRALEFFDKARASLGEQDRGREVVHLFRGMVYQRGAGEQYSFEADAEYEKALAINPEYSRAFLGVGYARLRRYEHQLTMSRLFPRDNSPPDPVMLAEAEQLVLSAQRAKDKPAEAQVDAKIQIALGTILLVAAQDVNPARYAEAEAAFSTVIRQFEAGDRDLAYLASFAYFGVGAIRELRDSDLSGAADLYRKALTVPFPHDEITTPATNGLERIEGKETKDSSRTPYQRPSRIIPHLPRGGMG